MSATSAPIYPNARMDALLGLLWFLFESSYLGNFTNTGHKYRPFGQDHSFSGDPAPRNIS